MKKLILLSMALSVLFTAITVAKDKIVVIKKVEVIANSLNARTGPTVKNFRLGGFERNTILPIYEEKDGWYRTICPSDAKIFISQQFIKVDGDNGVILGTNVNGRSRPDTQSVVCFKFDRKTKVTVKAAENGWIQIEPPVEANSWISSNAKWVKTISVDNQILVTDDKQEVVIADPSNKGNTNPENATASEIDITDMEGVSTSNSGNNKADQVMEERRIKQRLIEEATNKRMRDILLKKEKDKLKKGWVRRLGRVIGRKATHAIYITEGQDLFHLISKNPAIKLEDYASKFVGISGEDLGKEKRSKVPLISVNNIKIFKDKEPSIKLKSQKKKK